MEWTGNKGLGTQTYQAYGRDHVISASGKQIVIPGSSDPSFRGDESRYNPEELLVSTLSSCHMLWYLHLCSKNNLDVQSYLDHANGLMEETKNGSGRFISVTLCPEITLNNPEEMIPLADQLHHKAHEMCFIANSVNFEVNVKPSYSTVL